MPSDRPSAETQAPGHHTRQGFHLHKPERTHDVHPNLILAVLCSAGTAYSVLSSSVVPALPTFQHALHASETGSSWLLTGFLVSASVGTSVIGRLGDIYGKERLLLWTLLVLAVGTLLGAVANSLGVLICARVIQGVAGGIFPLAFAIARDEFPPDRVAGSIGFMSSILGVGGGAGLVLGALIAEHLGWHWLFWLPLVVILIGAAATWKWIPESPVRAPGKINWVAAVTMSVGMTVLLIGIAQTSVWGWGSPKSLALIIVGGLIVCAWIVLEAHSDNPLVDMTMMRIRGVWTTNLVAFMLGVGLYSAFVLFPEFAQLPKRTGFGFGASVLDSSLYMLPVGVGMFVLASLTGTIARRFGSKPGLVVGSAVTGVAFFWLAVQHGHPYDLVISSALIGVGVGLAFASLGNLIVGAVPPHQTGVASGMNTVMRTLGGALGGQVAATFIADNVAHGLPAISGFTDTFWMAAGFLIVSVFAGLHVPRARAAAASARLAVEPSPAR